ncbi:hypothetical protein FF38_04045 [Lucilia cuprina]|uniref:Uncharacterized protein n=1 Tax=Lucilia cuprina TaxID=7375 RepID=A0A0L0CIC0_LUCCU|nr:hypothetical protein FF38_04045 [Lucilia cuprina]
MEKRPSDMPPQSGSFLVGSVTLVSWSKSSTLKGGTSSSESEESGMPEDISMSSSPFAINCILLTSSSSRIKVFCVQSLREKKHKFHFYLDFATAVSLFLPHTKRYVASAGNHLVPAKLFSNYNLPTQYPSTLYQPTQYPATPYQSMQYPTTPYHPTQYTQATFYAPPPYQTTAAH